MNIRASADGTSGIGITDSLHLDGTVQFIGHTSARSLAVAFGDLTGSGLIYAGSTATGVESSASSLDPAGDWSNFTGVIKFHNTAGWFRGPLSTVDISSAQLFIEQADASDKTTLFYLEKDIIVRELNIAGTIYSAPATYTASDLTGMLNGERITFTDRTTNNHTITVIPEPATYAVFFGILALGSILVLRRRSSK